MLGMNIMDFNFSKFLNFNLLFSFLKKYYLLIFLFIFYVFFCIFYFGKCGNTYFDCFREAIIPEGILDGKIMFRDISVLYPPLGYYLNAFLFRCFGDNLTVLYISGMVNGFIILASIFYICRRLLNYNFAILCLILTMCIFTTRTEAVSVSSWFFPYSYSLFYAFSAILIAFAFFILYIQNKKDKFLYLSSLFTGLSIAFKLDYAAFIFLILFALIHKKSFSFAFKNILCLLIPIFAELCIFFMTGGNVHDIFTWVKFLEDFCNSKLIKEWTVVCLPTVMNEEHYEQFLHSMFLFTSFVGLTFFVLYSVLYNFFIKKNKIIPIIIIILTSIFICQYSINRIIYRFCFEWNGVHSNFAFLPILVLFISFCILTFKKQLTIKDKYFLLLYFFAFCLSYRNYLIIYISNIGNLNGIPYIIALVYFLFEVMPQNISNDLNKKLVKCSIAGALIVFALSYLNIYYDRKL